MRCSIPASRTKASHDHEEGPTNPPLAKHGGPPWPALSEPNAQHLCATRDHKQVWTYLQWLVPFAMYIYIITLSSFLNLYIGPYLRMFVQMRSCVVSMESTSLYDLRRECHLRETLFAGETLNHWMNFDE